MLISAQSVLLALWLLQAEASTHEWIASRRSTHLGHVNASRLGKRVPPEFGEAPKKAEEQPRIVPHDGFHGQGVHNGPEAVVNGANMPVAEPALPANHLVAQGGVDQQAPAGQGDGPVQQEPNGQNNQAAQQNREPAAQGNQDGLPVAQDGNNQDNAGHNGPQVINLIDAEGPVYDEDAEFWKAVRDARLDSGDFDIEILVRGHDDVPTPAVGKPTGRPTVEEQIAYEARMIKISKMMSDNGEISILQQKTYRAKQNGRIAGLKIRNSRMVKWMSANKGWTGVIAVLVTGAVYGFTRLGMAVVKHFEEKASDPSTVYQLSYTKPMDLTRNAILAGDDSSKCQVSANSGTVTPNLVLSFDADQITVTGSLEIDADLTLICADATGSTAEESSNQQLIVQPADEGGYGSLLASDLSVVSATAGMLDFRYKTSYSDLGFGLVGYGNATSAVQFCQNCIPDTTLGSVRSTAFSEQPSFTFTLSPSFFISNALANDAFLSWTFSETFNWSPESGGLPPNGVPDGCSNGMPVKQTISSMAAQLVSSDGSTGYPYILQIEGPDANDCTGFTGDGAAQVVPAAAPVVSSSSSQGLASASKHAPSASASAQHVKRHYAKRRL